MFYDHNNQTHGMIELAIKMAASILCLEDSRANVVINMLEEGVLSEVPYGPLESIIPIKYHKYLSKETLRSLLVTSEKEAGPLRQSADLASLNVITRPYKSEVFPQVVSRLNEVGQEAIKEINPWVLNTIIDMDNFDEVICNPQVPHTPSEAEYSREDPIASGKWTDNAVKYLLDLFKENTFRFNNPTCKKKTVWSEIASAMQTKGFQYDSDKCERKFLNLKGNYKKTKIHNNQSGNNRKTCPFYIELDEIFSKDPSIIPVSTSSSIKKGSAVKPQNCEYDSQSSQKHEDLSRKNKLPSKNEDPSGKNELSPHQIVSLEHPASSGKEKKEPQTKKLKKSDQIINVLEQHFAKQEKLEHERMEFLKEMKAEQTQQTERFLNIMERLLGEKK